MGYVLVVEDEASIRQLTTRLLERLGHRVKSACTAAEALELLPSERPDVLLCDVGLPDHSGFWVVSRVREQIPHLPVVMISGHSRKPPDAAAVGPVEWLSKPFERAEFVRVLERVLDNRSGN